MNECMCIIISVLGLAEAVFFFVLLMRSRENKDEDEYSEREIYCTAARRTKI